jgi:hypothetical protein
MTRDRHRESMRYIARLKPEVKPAAGGPSPDGTTPQDHEASTLIDFTEVEARRVKWAWRDRVALSKITSLSGRPKIGKGLLYSDLIAQATTGRLDGDLEGPGNVILVTTEDDPGDTLKRLMAAGADLARVSYFQMGTRDDPVPFRVPEHSAELGRRVAEKKAALVVIDPLIEFIDGKLDSHKSQAVRQAFASLNPLAREHGCAILVVIHLNKGASTDPLLRQEASAAFTQVVRGGLLLGRDPEDPDGETGDHRVLVVSASNLARIPPALVYRIDGAIVHGDKNEVIDTAAISGVGETTAIDSHDLLGGLDSEARTERDEAKDFYRAELAHGPQKVKDIERAAGKEHSTRTLKRARSELGVWAKKEPGQNGPWWNGLPGQAAPWELDPGGPRMEEGRGEGARVTPLAVAPFPQTAPQSGKPPVNRAESWRGVAPFPQTA